MTEKQEIIDCLKEMREVCAACFRVIDNASMGVVLLEYELNKLGIKGGFGLRCQNLIKKLEVEK